MATITQSLNAMHAVRLPPAIPDVPIYRFSVDQYHELAEIGILDEDSGVELLEGWVFIKHPPEESLTVGAGEGRPPGDEEIPDWPIFRFSVDDYHAMIAAGILKSGDPVEFIEGWLVPKMTKNPPHRIALGSLRDLIEANLPVGWYVDTQEAVTLDSGEPEPDVSVARGKRRDYADRHPGPQDLALVVEVADATLRTDRGAKKRQYAAAGIVEYWIVNLLDRRIEVYSQPSGRALIPNYAQRQDYAAGTEVPLRIAGQLVGQISVNEVLPWIYSSWNLPC